MKNIRKLLIVPIIIVSCIFSVNFAYSDDSKYSLEYNTPQFWNWLYNESYEFYCNVNNIPESGRKTDKQAKAEFNDIINTWLRAYLKKHNIPASLKKIISDKYSVSYKISDLKILAGCVKEYLSGLEKKLKTQQLTVDEKKQVLQEMRTIIKDTRKFAGEFIFVNHNYDNKKIRGIYGIVKDKKGLCADRQLLRVSVLQAFGVKSIIGTIDFNEIVRLFLEAKKNKSQLALGHVINIDKILGEDLKWRWAAGEIGAHNHEEVKRYKKIFVALKTDKAPVVKNVDYKWISNPNNIDKIDVSNQYARATAYFSFANQYARCARLTSKSKGPAGAKKYFDKAVNAYTTAYSLAPESSDILMMRGSTYRDMGKFQKAHIDYQTAININPRYALIYNNRGDLYYKEADTAYENTAKTFARKKYTKAISDYNKWLKLQPGISALRDEYARVRKYIFKAYYEKGAEYPYDKNNKAECEQAVKFFTNIIRHDKSYTRAYMHRGVAFGAIENYSKAVEDMTYTITNDPATQAYILRGLFYFKQNQYNNALGDFTKAIQLDEKAPRAYVCRADTFYKLKKYSEALEDYRHASALSKHHFKKSFNKTSLLYFSNAYAALGNDYFAKKQYEDALSCFRKALGINKNNTAAYYNIAGVYVALKKYSEAAYHYNQVLKVNPNHTLSLFNRGSVHMKLGNFKQAIADYSKAISVSKKPQPVFYFCRGNAYFNIKQFDKAIQDYNQTIKLSPKYAPAYANRADIHYLRKDFTKAANDYFTAHKYNDKILKTYPCVIEAFVQSAKIYKSKGKYKQARQELTRALKISPNNKCVKKMLRQFSIKSSRNTNTVKPIYPDIRSGCLKGDFERI